MAPAVGIQVCPLKNKIQPDEMPMITTTHTEGWLYRAFSGNEFGTSYLTIKKQNINR
jgi:hypothetical protein